MLLGTVAALCVLGMSAGDNPPKREFRSIWMAAMGIDWPYKEQIGNERLAKAAFIEYIENFKRHNIQNICLQIRPLADALYRSSLEPWAESVTGTRGKDPGWDPLQFAIEECHKRGMELYAWINPFRIDNQGRVYTTPYDLEWREKGWELKSGSWTIFNIAVPDARQHCLDVMREVYTNYDIDGMLFDDYFYPGDHLTTASTAGDYSMYLEYKKKQEADKKPVMSIADWRRDNVNRFVEEIYQMIQRDRPDMRFGIGPAGTAGKSAAKHGVTAPSCGYDWQYDDIFADPLAWLHDGTIDFIAPQIYWARTESPAFFTPLAEWWSYVAQHFGRHNYISMASYKVDKAAFGGNNEKGWSEIVAQIEIGRSNAKDNAPGQIYFSATQFDGPVLTGLGDWVETHAYQRPSLTPVITWKDHYVYQAPAGVNYADGKLSWTATKGERDNSIIRYSIYAIPRAKALEDALDPNGDGISGEYLVDVSYDTQYTIPADKQADYWYAVCVLDGYGYESKPGTALYTGERSRPTTLLGPAKGAVPGWDAEFTWTPVDGAEYLIEVSQNADFTLIYDRQTGLKQPKAIVDLGGLRDNTTCYWRVAVCEPMKIYTYTDASTFLSPTRVDAVKATLIGPVGNESSASVKFSWQPVPDADSYRVEVSHDADFSTTAFRDVVQSPETTVEVPAIAIGYDELYWRVMAYGRRINTSLSDAAKFNMSRMPVGTYEQGYTIGNVKDVAMNTNHIVTMTWQRSTVDASNPLPFTDNGSLNRSMVVTHDFVFVTGRDANSRTASAYLSQYDLLTGEHLRDIKLYGDEYIPTYPCNQVVTDARGDVYVFDYATNVTSRPLVLKKVDLVTGKLTEVVELKGKTTTATRVDYAALYGDVLSGDYVVFAVVNNKSTLLRWVVKDGEVEDLNTVPTTNFSAAVKTHGLAPRLFPIDETRCWVDGTAAPATLYNFVDGTFSASIPGAADGLELADNGIAFFESAGSTFMIYNCGASSTGSCYRVARVGSAAGDFDTFDVIAEIKAPAADNAAEGSSPVSAYADANGAYFATYSPGNYLAGFAYKYTHGVYDVTVDKDDSIHVADGIVTADGDVEIRAYSPAGALIGVAAPGTALTLDTPGLYIVQAGSAARRVVIK